MKTIKEIEQEAIKAYEEQTEQRYKNIELYLKMRRLCKNEKELKENINRFRAGDIEL